MSKDQYLNEIARRSRISAITSILGLLVVISSLMYSAYNLNLLEAKVDIKKKELSDLETQIAKEKEQINKLRPFALKGLGYTDEKIKRMDHSSIDYAGGLNLIDTSQLTKNLQKSTQVIGSSAAARSINEKSVSMKTEESIKANEAAQDIISSTETERRRNITIKYYPKALEQDVNQNIVIPHLNENGFKLIRKLPQVTNIATNSLWFGENVDLDDVKLVAYILVGAGSDIRAIRPFRDVSGSKASIIEIGADVSQVNKPIWTVKRLRAIRSFSRE